MSTRGYLGIRNNASLITGRYNHYDSYYQSLGVDICSLYFSGELKKDNQRILNLSKDENEDTSFIHDGLYCEFSYVYNLENDTLEVYRGFFKNKQIFNVKDKILYNLERNGKEEEYFPHLIFIVDRKKHSYQEVLSAFEKYTGEEGEGLYPEREIIPLSLPEGYVLIV